MDLDQFKDSVCYLSLAGTVVTLQSLTQEVEGLIGPFNFKYVFVTDFCVFSEII